MKIDLCDECKKKLKPDATSILALDDGSERVVLFAFNLTHDIISTLNKKVENYEFTEIQQVQDTLDYELIRPLNHERMKRGENSLL